MKINYPAGLERYQSYVNNLKNGDVAAGKAQVDGKAAGTDAPHTDKVTLSGDAVAKAELSRMATAISTEVDAMGTTQRIAELREQVQNGSYFVSSDKLADAILGAGDNE